jgi:hypothetical protein
MQNAFLPICEQYHATCEVILFTNAFISLFVYLSSSPFLFLFCFVHNVTDHNSDEIAERERGFAKCGGGASDSRYIYRQNSKAEALQSQNLSHPFQATKDTDLKYAGKKMSLMFAFTTQSRTSSAQYCSLMF